LSKTKLGILIDTT